MCPIDHIKQLLRYAFVMAAKRDDTLIIYVYRVDRTVAIQQKMLARINKEQTRVIRRELPVINA